MNSQKQKKDGFIARDIIFFVLIAIIIVGLISGLIVSLIFIGNGTYYLCSEGKKYEEQYIVLKNNSWTSATDSGKIKRKVGSIEFYSDNELVFVGDLSKKCLRINNKTYYSDNSNERHEVMFSYELDNFWHSKTLTTTHGKTISPAITEPFGYNIVGWTDVYGEIFDFSQPIYSSFKLMAVLETNCFEYFPNYVGDQIDSYSVRLANDLVYDEIHIPSEYEGKPVTKILQHKTGLKYGWPGFKLFIPDTVVEIESSAFFDLNVTYVKLSKNLTEIKERTFYTCGYLEKVDMFEGIESIGKEAFYYCYSLNEIDLPESLKSIEEKAFYYCNINNLEIPASVEYVGQGAFYGGNGYSVNNLVLPPNLDTIYANTFSYGGFFGVTIGDKVAAIGRMAFFASNLRSVVIPENVKFIDADAFSGCSFLRKVTIDSAEIAQSHLEQDYGGLLENAEMVYVRSDIKTIGNYIKVKFKFLGDTDIDGVKYGAYIRV